MVVDCVGSFVLHDDDAPLVPQKVFITEVIFYISLFVLFCQVFKAKHDYSLQNILVKITQKTTKRFCRYIIIKFDSSVAASFPFQLYLSIQSKSGIYFSIFEIYLGASMKK